MKKLIVLSAALFGTVAASKAGVHFDFGVNVPLPGEIIVGHRAPAPVISAPPVVYDPAPAPVYAPAPSYEPVPAPVCSAPAPVVAAPPVCAPAPQVIYSQPVVVPTPVCYPRGHGWYAWRNEHWRHEWQEHHREWR